MEDDAQLGTDLCIGRRTEGLWYLDGYDDGRGFAEESRFGMRPQAWSYVAPLDFAELAMLARRPLI